MSRAFVVACIALLTGCAAYAVALVWLPASHFNGHYSPVGVDSFYHARRILDAVANPDGFYEFDPHIHAPEGSWVTWPWAYDELLAWIVRTIEHATGAREPMAILAFIPPTWVFVNAALLIAIGDALGVSAGGLLLVGAAFAFSSLTQMLHAVGVIDHHYVEYTFVLATLLSGLLWFRAPERAARAAVTGLVLGAAPAFHNGLFSLQIPVDVTLFMLWLRGAAPPLRAALAFAAALLAATLGAVVPSDPFRDGQFSMTTLSWFHLYVAALSMAGALYLSARSRTPASIALLVLGGIAALLPAANEIVTGSHFLSASLVKLDEIAEALNLWRQVQVFGIHGVIVTYSGWIVLLPLAAGASVFAIARGTTPPFWLFAAIFGLFGMVLMCFQARLHYFGSPVLFLFPALVLREIRARLPARRGLPLCGVVLAGLAAGYVLPWKELWTAPPAAWDFSGTYAIMDRTIYPRLREACAAHPGIVLADNNAGHYIRFNTECSVISNNFILTPQHERKLLETQRLLSLSAQQMAVEAPYVDYVFVQGSGANSGLAAELLADATAPAGFELLAEVKSSDGVARARVFHVNHPRAARTGRRG